MEFTGKIKKELAVECLQTIAPSIGSVKVTTLLHHG
jgi:hypothetical protein